MIYLIAILFKMSKRQRCFSDQQIQRGYILLNSHKSTCYPVIHILNLHFLIKHLLCQVLKI